MQYFSPCVLLFFISSLCFHFFLRGETDIENVWGKKARTLKWVINFERRNRTHKASNEKKYGGVKLPPVTYSIHTWFEFNAIQHKQIKYLFSMLSSSYVFFFHFGFFAIAVCSSISQCMYLCMWCMRIYFSTRIFSSKTQWNVFSSSFAFLFTFAISFSSFHSNAKIRFQQ